MKYFIGIVPPEAVYHKLLDIQRQHGDNRLEPHITLRPRSFHQLSKIG